MKHKTIFLSLILLFSCNNNVYPSMTSINSDSQECSIPELETIHSASENYSSNIIDDTTSSEISSKFSASNSYTGTKLNIYINPSVQTKNMYYNNVTTEAIMMNKIADEMYNYLKNNPKFNIYINNRYLNLTSSVKEINSLNIDYHIALHSNAGGGKGSECYHYNSYNFAQKLLKKFDMMHSFPSRGVKDGSHLYELKKSKAKNKVLIELLFHDNKIESEFIQKNYKQIGLNLAKTIEELN